MLANKIINSIRYLVLKSNGIKLFNWIYLQIYKLSLIFIVTKLNKIRAIGAIYLEGSLARGYSQFKAGSTDIDLVIITQELGLDSALEFIHIYIKRYIQLKKLIPFLKDSCALNEAGFYIYGVAKTLGPYHLKSNGALYKPIYGKVDSRSIQRLKLGFQSCPLDDLFMLAQNALKPINEDLYRTANENWVYIRNTVISIKRFAEYANRRVPDFKSETLADRLNKKIQLISSRNFFIYSTDRDFFISFINDFYALLAECLNYLIANTPRIDPPKLKEISMAKCGLPDKNITCIVEIMKNEFLAICKNEAGILHNISILPTRNCSYGYEPYIIFNNNLEPKTINNIYAALKKISISFPQFYCCFNPAIITKDMSCVINKYVQTYRGPLEMLLFNELKLTVGGALLDNRLNQEIIDNFINTKLYGSISKVEYSYLVEPRNKFEQLIEQLQNKNLEGAIQTIDYLLGAVASHRLAIEKRIITTSSFQTLTEYMAHYRDAEDLWYESFYHKFYNTKTEISLNFIDSQLKDLFYFCRKNAALIDDIVSAKLKSNYLTSNPNPPS